MKDSLDRHDLLERLTVAAGERQLAEKTISAYRRTWLQLIAWSTAEGFALETLPREKAREYYDALTAKRGASHHLQVRAAISALYRHLDTPNAFRECLAPRFDIERVELEYLQAPQIAMLLGELRENSGDYFGTLTYHLAEALFHTGKRYHEWAGLHRERLVGVGEDLVARMRLKGGKFADVPIPAGLGRSLRSWLEFLDAAKGARLRRGAMGFVASALVFPGRDGKPVSNQAFNARLREACRRAAIPVITAHGLRHSAATILLNRPGGNLRKVQRYLQHRSLATTARYTHVEHGQLREMADDLEVATGNTMKV